MKQGKLYTYRNKKTGATMKTTVKCAGSCWEQVNGAKAPEPIPVEQPEQAEGVVEPKKSKKARK